MKANPYEKFLSIEDRLHHAIIQYLRLQYPKIIFFHSPNEGKRTKFEQFKLSYLGGNNVKTPDLAIMQPNKDWHGLFLEIKSKNPYKENGLLYTNKHIEVQAKLLLNLEKYHYHAVFTWSFDDAKQIIDNYMKNI